MGERFCGNDIFCRKPTELETDKTYMGKHTPDELMAAFTSITGKVKAKLPPDQTTFTPIVTHKIVSVASRIIFVLKKLYKNSRVKFLGFFEKSKSRSERVATFLAILELVKAGRLKVEDDEIIMDRSGGRKKDDDK